MPRRPARSLIRRVAVGATATLVVGCSTSDGTDIDAGGGTDATSPPSSQVAESDLPIQADTLPGEPTPSTAQTSPPGSASTPAPASEIPEAGVPGLDSDDAFCAAWSRFGGSFQVIAVNAAFGAGSVVEGAFVEVAASPSVVAAHGDMAEQWPDEIAAEADVALGETFGPLVRRLTAARDALVAEGATSEQLDRLDSAWVAFLAERSPTDAEVVLALDDDLADVVAAAVPVFLDEVGPWADDDSLITDAATPLTDEYLATECPDQGTLAGGEVDS